MPNKQLDETLPEVTCTRCNTTFECFHGDQAHGCSADLTADMRIRGHYGSTVADMTTFRFASSHAWIEAGPLKPGSICDACITELQEQGLIEVESHY
jgi:hypothetical protein